MLNLYLRLQLQASSVVGDGDDENVDVGGYSSFYSYDISVVCMTIFVFCVLVSTVSIWKACIFTILAVLLLGATGWYASRQWFRRMGRRGVRAELVVVMVVAAGAARPSYPCGAQVVKDAPAAFAFQCPVEAAGGGEGESASASCVVCSVCLEDVRSGEMVRQVPTCRHVFHVGCIDMWLHSHRTCPMCRCEVSPVAKVTTPKDAAAAEEVALESSDHHELPPV